MYVLFVECKINGPNMRNVNTTAMDVNGRVSVCTG